MPKNYEAIKLKMKEKYKDEGKAQEAASKIFIGQGKSKKARSKRAKQLKKD